MTSVATRAADAASRAPLTAMAALALMDHRILAVMPGPLMAGLERAAA